MKPYPTVAWSPDKVHETNSRGWKWINRREFGNYLRRSRGCLTQDVHDHAEKGFFVHSEVGIWLVGLYDLIYHLLVICSRLGKHHLLLRGHFPTKEKGWDHCCHFLHYSAMPATDRRAKESLRKMRERERERDVFVLCDLRHACPYL